MTTTFTAWLQQQLDERGWSQNQLARELGFTSAGISRIMTGTRQPGIKTCVRLAQTLNVDLLDLLNLAGIGDDAASTPTPTTPANDLFIDWLREQMATRGWSQNQMAREIGVNHGTLSTIFNGKRRPGIETYLKIAQALGVDITEVLARAGYELPGTGVAESTGSAAIQPPELPQNADQEPLLPAPVADAFATWLKAEMEQRRWDDRQLARATGVGRGYVQRLLVGALPSAHYCQELAIAFSLPVDDIAQRAGHSSAPAGHTVTVDAIVRYLERLPQADQDAVSRYVANLYSQREAKRARAQAPKTTGGAD